jgi:hypothetical protein
MARVSKRQVVRVETFSHRNCPRLAGCLLIEVKRSSMLRCGNRTRTGLRLQNPSERSLWHPCKFDERQRQRSRIGQLRAVLWLQMARRQPTAASHHGFLPGAPVQRGSFRRDGAATGGRIKIEVFPSGALVRPFETFDAFHVIRFMAS